jgi:hypothetical protein
MLVERSENEITLFHLNKYDFAAANLGTRYRCFLTSLPTWTIAVDENGYLRLAWDLPVFLVNEKGHVFEALTSPRGTFLVTTGNWEVIPLLSTAPITVLHLQLRMDFERKENAEGYDICLPCEYTYSGYVVSYEVRKFITSAEHVRIYMEVTRYELERQNTSLKVASRP